MGKIERRMNGETLELYDGSEKILSMQELLDNQSVSIKMTGSLLSSVDHDVYDELLALSTVGKDLIVDLGHVDYVSNACQNSFLRLQQQMDSMERGSLEIVNTPEAVYEAFEKVGLTELLMIEK